MMVRHSNGSGIARRRRAPDAPAATLTRRDFLGAALLGAGAELLAMEAPASSHTIPPPLQQDEWTGYGGIGEYASSNGNTASVVAAAHGALRDRASDVLPRTAAAPERFDVVVVGGGLSGLGAAWALRRRGASCLVLENHAIFGGEAKQNELRVRGHRLWAPQGSNAFTLPDAAARAAGWVPPIWDELGLPADFEFAALEGTARDIRFALDSYGSMLKAPERASIGYFYPAGDGSARCIVDAQADGFARAPLSPRLRAALNEALHGAPQPPHVPVTWRRWLDGMSYAGYLERELGAPAAIRRYVEPYLAAAAFGVCADAVSAYGAYLLRMPGMQCFLTAEERAAHSSQTLASFPGGNTLIVRQLLRRLLPEALPGRDFASLQYGRVHAAALDRPGAWLRVRHDATVLEVAHAGAPERAAHVIVRYLRDGRLHAVQAHAVVIATGGSAARRMLRDAPAALAAAYASFHHAPMLVVNVALTNWRFMERLGISAARWFEGFGWFANLRRPMILGGRAAPLDPGQPAVLTFYVPLLPQSGASVREQTAAARRQLLALSYAHIERAVLGQLARLFAASGFVAARDVAALVVNRWGHAYLAPQPGFYFGAAGQLPAREVVRRGYGRVRIGHSELSGLQYWTSAFYEGERAGREAGELL